MVISMLMIFRTFWQYNGKYAVAAVICCCLFFLHIEISKRVEIK